MTNLMVGSYTRDTHSDGIYRIEAGEITLAASCENPSFLAWHPNGDVLYAVSEVADYEQNSTGAVCSFFRQANGQLTLMNSQPSMGADPCHITVSTEGRYLIVSNYSGGTFTSYPLDSEGHIEQFISMTQHSGQGQHPQRQEAAHVHSSVLIDNESAVLIADLGADQLVKYQISKEGQIDTQQRLSVAATPGAGPRMFCVSDDSAYLLNELNNTISEHRLSDLSQKNVAATLPEQANSIAAHIDWSPDKQFIYASNRGEDSISVFDKNLNCLQTIKTGRHPRHFLVDDKQLYVGCMLDDEIQVFDREISSGLIGTCTDRISVPQPTCLVFTQ